MPETNGCSTVDLTLLGHLGIQFVPLESVGI
jgi:hypothetical protein